MHDTIFSISGSSTNAPCTLIGFIAPTGLKRMSPLPRSFSAPGMSIIVLESICDATVQAIRDGMLFLMVPVMTSTDGRCVPMIRCIPAALAFAARRAMELSTLSGAVAMRSASSSIMMTILGIGFISGFPAAFSL